MENKTEKLMKMTVAVEKLFHYMQGYNDLYLRVANLIAITPDVEHVQVRILIGGQLYTLLAVYEFDDEFTIIDIASETIRAALCVKRILSAG